MMPRPNITNLRPAGRSIASRLSKAGFETKNACRRDDARRARQLGWRVTRECRLIDTVDAKALQRRLRKAATSQSMPRTLASRCYCRKHRLRLTAQLVQLAARYDAQEVSTFTLVAKAWTVTPTQLLRFDPRKMLNAVRTDLNRCGIAKLDGAVFMAVDGDYNPDRNLFQLHVHGVAYGATIQAVGRLRRRRKYRAVRGEDPRTLPIHRPVRIDWEVDDHPKALSYIWKSYWPTTVLVLNAEGKLLRKRSPRPIAEPCSSLYLLWLDKWSLSDVTLMMGMEVVGGQLRIRRKQSR